MRGERLLVCAVGGVLACVLAAACGASAAMAPDPSLTAPERMRAWARIARTAPFQTLRYNPTAASCEAPPFEVRVGDRWWRVRLVPGGAGVDDLAALERRAAAAQLDRRVGFFYATGSLDDVPLPLCRNGTLGFVLLVDAIHDTPPAAPEAVL